MSEESLEQRIEEDTKSSLWDFFVAAYSSSRAVKILLSTISAGYSYIACAAASVGFYLATKTIGLTVKYITKFVINPLKNYNPIDFIYKNISSYNPFGQQKRPHFMGAALSGINYLTGF
jgi:hypothetical protein